MRSHDLSCVGQAPQLGGSEAQGLLLKEICPAVFKIPFTIRFDRR